MVEWRCPFCEKEMYSSCEDRDQKTVVCVNCGQIMPNPYYEEKQNNNYIN